MAKVTKSKTRRKKQQAQYYTPGAIRQAAAGISDAVGDATERIKALPGDIRKTAAELKTSTEEVFDGLRGDTRLVLAKIEKQGLGAPKWAPRPKAWSRLLSKRLKGVARKNPLSTRSDIQQLTASLEELKQRVDALGQDTA